MQEHGGKRVDILVFEGCPHLEIAIERVRDALSRLGIAADVRIVHVENETQAKELRFLGSPTVQVAGVDVKPTVVQRNECAMQCRVYSVNGRFEGAPPREWIETALRGA